MTKKIKEKFDKILNTVSLKRIPKKLETFDFKGIKDFLLTNWLSKDHHELVMWTAEEIESKTQTRVKKIIDTAIEYYKIKRNVEEYKKAIIELMFKNKKDFFDTNIESISPRTPIKISLQKIINMQIKALDKLMEDYTITSLEEEMKHWNKSWLGEKTGYKVDQEQIDYLDNLYKNHSKNTKPAILVSRANPISKIKEKE